MAEVCKTFTGGSIPPLASIYFEYESAFGPS